MRPVNAPRVAYATTRLPIPQRRPTPEQVELARWYLEQAPPDLDERAFIRRIYGHPYTFHDGRPPSNEHHVRELLGIWEWQRRAGGRQLVEELEVQAVVIGDVAIVACPVELFAAFGRRLKAQSPFRIRSSRRWPMVGTAMSQLRKHLPEVATSHALPTAAASYRRQAIC